MRNLSLIALVCLCCLCIAAAPADACRVWRVPGDALTLAAAIDLADPGDVIEIAPGVHKIAGRGIELKAGLTIRPDTGMPGAVVLRECGCYCGDFRNAPIFELDQAGPPVRFEGLIFKDFMLCCGQFPGLCNPIFHVDSGTLMFEDCRFEHFYRAALWFDGGTGVIRNTDFVDGCGCPGAILFAGEQLVIEDSRFEQFRWYRDCFEYRGNVLVLDAGETTMLRTEFVDNGPLIQLVTVGVNGRLEADDSCFCGNAAIWEGEVAGYARLDGCEVDPVLWHELPGGEVIIVDDPGKAMTIETATWTGVKKLFD